jgi:hypothetical protein
MGILGFGYDEKLHRSTCIFSPLDFSERYTLNVDRPRPAVTEIVGSAEGVTRGRAKRADWGIGADAFTDPREATPYALAAGGSCARTPARRVASASELAAMPALSVAFTTVPP